MSKTVVGLFNSTAEAQQVKQSLVSNGYSASDINIMANDQDGMSKSMTGTGTGVGTGTGTGVGSTVAGAAEGIGQKISNFFSSLTGGDDDVHGHYATGVNQGGALLTVKADDNRANEIASLLKQHGAREIEGNLQSKASTGTSNAAALTGQTAIPVIEEELVVGKREVDRGGVRVYSHVVERPVEADVTLRDERVNVERRAVDRPATAADFEAGKDASFELRATGEEAVVGKNSRVVEEVMVGKQSDERTEAVRDTVRKTEVEVEQIAGNTGGDTGNVKTEKNRY